MLFTRNAKEANFFLHQMMMIIMMPRKNCNVQNNNKKNGGMYVCNIYQMHNNIDTIQDSLFWV